MSNSSKSDERFGLEDLLYLEKPNQDVIFNLNTDQITRMKQTIIAIPYINFVLNEHYQEVMSAVDFQSMCLQLNLLKKRIIANPYLESKIKRKLLLTFVFHINQFLDNYDDPSQLPFVLLFGLFKSYLLFSFSQFSNVPVQTEFPLVQLPQENLIVNNQIPNLPLMNYQFQNYSTPTLDFRRLPLVRNDQQPNDYIQQPSSDLNFIEPDYSQMNSMSHSHPPIPSQNEVSSLAQMKIELLQKLQRAPSKILGEIAQRMKPGEDDIMLDIDSLTIEDINELLSHFR